MNAHLRFHNSQGDAREHVRPAVMYRNVVKKKKHRTKAVERLTSYGERLH